MAYVSKWSTYTKWQSGNNIFIFIETLVEQSSGHTNISQGLFLLILLHVSWCSQGSVVVDFRVIFDEEVSDDQALSVLKNAVKDGKLGTFKVDSTSVKSISPTAGPRGKYTRKSFLFISPFIN